MANPFTTIPFFKTTLGTSGVGDRIPLFNSDGELVGNDFRDSFIQFGNITGLAQGGFLTVNADTSKIDQAEGFGYIVNGHTNVEIETRQKISWSTQTAITIPNIATQKQTYVSRDINGALFFTANPLTAEQRRDYIRIGVLIHLDNATITQIDFNPTVAVELGGQVQDILESIGFKCLNGNRIFPVSTNLKIKKEAGRAFKSGANFNNLNTQPHSFNLPAQEPITFRYRTQTGAEGVNITDINPAIYDVNGTITAMPATATLATIQRIYVFQDNVIRIQPGQRFFNNLNEAVTAINSDIFITDSDILNNGLYLGAIVLIRGTTNLSLLAQAIFVPSQGTSANGSIPAIALPSLSEVNAVGNITDVRMIGDRVFPNKTPEDFAQIGDIAEENSTNTALTLASLNTDYAVRSIGFMVICSNIDRVYVKMTGSWREINTTNVT
jgi:hypothetical protein